MITYPSDKNLFPCYYPEWQDKRIDTTFWNDFTIADAFGTSGIQDTYNRAFNEWKNDYRYLTELVAVLNHKIWHWFNREGRESERAKLYDRLWKQADGWAARHLKGDEASFFHWVLD